MTIGDIYEGLLRDLQSAGNYGEFYTPRAMTEIMTEIINPRLGEKVLDIKTPRLIQFNYSSAGFAA